MGALLRIANIKNELDGDDWSEIEKARQIARAALTTAQPYDGPNGGYISIIEKLRNLDDGVSRPVGIMEREVCSDAANIIERVFLAGANTPEGLALLPDALARIRHLESMVGIPTPAQQPPVHDDVNKSLTSLSYWCTDERLKIGNVDGHDYRSGEEFGIRRVEVEIEKRLTALAAQPPAYGQDVYEAIIAGIGAADMAVEQAPEIVHALGRAGYTIAPFDAQPPAARVETWQPYATAPRDGTPILCYWGPSVPGGARAIDVAVWINGNWCDSDDAETHFGEPDLWQHLNWPSVSRSSADIAKVILQEFVTAYGSTECGTAGLDAAYKKAKALLSAPPQGARK